MKPWSSEETDLGKRNSLQRFRWAFTAKLGREGPFLGKDLRADPRAW